MSVERGDQSSYTFYASPNTSQPGSAPSGGDQTYAICPYCGLAGGSHWFWCIDFRPVQPTTVGPSTGRLSVKDGIIKRLSERIDSLQNEIERLRTELANSEDRACELESRIYKGIDTLYGVDELEFLKKDRD